MRAAPLGHITSMRALRPVSPLGFNLLAPLGERIEVRG
jgi:hypothetical protein